MVKRIGGNRRKTRHKFQKKHREKGKVSITRYLQEFKAGDKVQLHAEPAVQKGMYYRRFHGKTATVLRKIKNCYEIMVTDGGKGKVLIVHPVHLKKV